VLSVAGVVVYNSNVLFVAHTPQHSLSPCLFLDLYYIVIDAGIVST
jgi:hypothetical protein